MSDIGFVGMASFVIQKKLEAMVITFHKALKTNWDINIFYRDSVLKQQRHFKNLGVAVDRSLSWNNHVSYVSLRVYPKLKLLNRVSSFLSHAVFIEDLQNDNLIILDLSCIVWGFCSK